MPQEKCTFEKCRHYNIFTDLILTVSTERCPIAVTHFDSVPVKEICAQKTATQNRQVE
jgi:hypothetical protein